MLKQREDKLIKLFFQESYLAIILLLIMSFIFMGTTCIVNFYDPNTEGIFSTELIGSFFMLIISGCLIKELTPFTQSLNITRRSFFNSYLITIILFSLLISIFSMILIFIGSKIMEYPTFLEILYSPYNNEGLNNGRDIFNMAVNRKSLGFFINFIFLLNVNIFVSTIGGIITLLEMEMKGEKARIIFIISFIMTIALINFLGRRILYLLKPLFTNNLLALFSLSGIILIISLRLLKVINNKIRKINI